MLEAIGYDHDLARWAARSDSRLGRVLHVERGVATVLTDRGELRATYGGRMLGWIAAQSAAAPCVGDWAVLRDWPDGKATVERIVPRRTSLVGCLGAHVLAANVDLVAVVVAADALERPAPDQPRLPPLVRMAEASGARPLVVLTRCDRVGEPRGLEDCRLLATSARTGRGVDELGSLLEGHLTLALVGPPGQGRSALLRAMLGDLAAYRSPRRTLHLLPQGGAVIDTPRLRAVT